jgi:hypothetical protein
MNSYRISKKRKTIRMVATIGLYGLVLKRIIKLEVDPKTKIVRFPDVFECLCKSMQISKNEAWEILFLLNDLGFLKIVPYQGVILKK